LIVIYTPAGGESQQYDANSLRVSEAAIVQRTVDMKWQAILTGLEQDDLDAMRGIVWVLKKRSEPSLRWGDFDPGVLEMTSRMDDGEMERWITNAVANADADLDWETIRTIIDRRLDEVAADPERARAVLAAQAPDPKAETSEPDIGSEPEPPAEEPSPTPSPTSPEPETATSRSSPTSSTSRRPRSTTSSSATSTT
jgi:hypothetical protein